MVLNEGESTEYLHDIELRAMHPDGAGVVHVHPLAPHRHDDPGWPREIPPRGSATFDHLFKGADDFEWLRGGLIGVAYLSSGRKVSSDVHHVEWRDPPDDP
jgi:hypothetical protein